MKSLSYYSNISVVPTKPGSKEQKHSLWNYKRYGLQDIQPSDNISMHTGSEAFPDGFTAVLDLDYDIRQHWTRLQPLVSRLFSDTVIVQSGGQHHGLHVHYLTSRPMRSQSTATQYGITELKGIGQDGSPDVIVLPPSKVINQYRVIHPYKGLYVDFSQVKRISPEEMKNKFHSFIKEINQL